jgi:hypothetical protein
MNNGWILTMTPPTRSRALPQLIAIARALLDDAQALLTDAQGGTGGPSDIASQTQSILSDVSSMFEEMESAINNQFNHLPECRRRDWRRGVRRFRSGIVGLGSGQTARVHVVNTTLEPSSVAKTAWVQGWSNPRSEPLGEGTALQLLSGVSAFQDFQPTAAGVGQRAQIRVMVTVLNDPGTECIVTFEVFDNESGRTAMIMQIPEDAQFGQSRTDQSW